LGSILYEMATGNLAFKKDTIPQTLAAIIDEDPEPIRKLRPEIPVELSAIVKRCLSKDPAERYESTGDLTRELKTVPETPSAWRARRRFLWAVAGFLVAALAVALGPNLRRLWDQISRSSGPAPIESIAVLPLQNLSGDPEQEYFADGMTEALITDLAKIGALKVISRSSVMRYKGTDKPLAEIAGELNVDVVVEGSALRVGDSVRIMAQLIDPKTEQALWADSYEQDLENVLLLWGEVAQAIAGEVQVALTPEETKRLAGARPIDPEAHDAYLKGSYHWPRLTPEDLDTAERYFELALEKDRSYGAAYAGLAMVWACRQQMGLVPALEAGPRANAAALRALELDSTLAEAHYAVGSVRTYVDWDWQDGEAAFRRAIALNPSYAFARASYSHLLMITRRPDEALTQIERALELDPFNPLLQGFYGMDLCFVRRYDDCIAECQEVLKTVPNNWLALGGLWQASYKKGMYEEALAAAKAYYTTVGYRQAVEALERGYAEGGYPEAMRLAAETLAADSTFVRPLELAVLYTYAGNNERALEWLERSFQAHDPGVPYIGIAARFDPLRDHPRFQDLLRRMNLPTTSARSDPDEQR
jgi:TolB-like protein/Tfp pilus assembly protein PilF